MNVTKAFGMVRDNQRSKVYKAQKAIDQFAERHETIADVERFVEKVKSRATIQRRYGKQLERKIIVKDGRGRSNAGGCEDYITLPLWARQSRTILHELAHTIAMRKYGRRNIAGHGWQFCAVYLDLVRFVMGSEAGETLKASFRQHKVRYREPTKRNMTPEQRQAAAERMAMARAAKLAA